MVFFQRKKPESPDELEQDGYRETAKFMRWTQKNTSRLPVKDVELMMDLARGDSVLSPCGRFFLEENKRELLFRRLNSAIECAHGCGESPATTLHVALAALELNISQFKRVTEAS